MDSFLMAAERRAAELSTKLAAEMVPDRLGPSAMDATDVALQRILRWTDALSEVDDVWRSLQAEKAAGWASEAVDWVWRQHDAHMANADRDRKVFTPSTKKYVRFYREWMPVLAPAFATRNTSRSFADIGASPGGMCEYLVRDLGWRGHAFSLSTADGGFGMAFGHANLGYTDADLAADGAWQHLLRAVPSTNFVNAGIVVDRGQKKAQGTGTFDEEGAEGWARTVRSLEFGIILRNELLFALRALCQGGHLYFAYQLGIYSMLYRVLLALRPAFRTVRVTPTFAAHRTPIYVFLGDYAGMDSPAGRAALDSLEALPTDGPEAFAAWHVSEWDGAVRALHAELASDFHGVWKTQERHLRKQRAEAEHQFAYRGARDKRHF